jgi:predicted CXXCH cytochrome family protein
MKLTTNSRKMALAGLLTMILCFTGGSTSWAKITGTPDACSFDLCHDMQAGNENLMKDEYAGNQGCFNCHSSDISSTTYELTDGVNSVTVPVVVYTGGSEPTEYLAGGNFWWVKGPATGDPQDPNYWTGGGDDTKGHNVFPGEGDDNLSSAPYGTGCTYGTFCHANLHTEDTSGLAGPRQGCLKCHMMKTSGAWPAKGFHHADDTLDPVVGGDTADTDGYFRFLSGHMAGDGYGVCGIEDDDWEATSSSSDHNEYLGFSGAKNAAGSLSVLGHTVTGFCSGCHGNKHISSDSAGGGEWIRHPSGASPLDNAYTEYSPRVPASRPDLTGWTVPSSTVTPVTDMVMCLSCHRAHGSPYPKMLRWETVGGCDDCHKGAIQCAE